MLCQSLLCSKVTPFYSYGHVLYSFPLWFITGYWESFPVLYSRTLLFAHPLYNSLHMLIPISYSFPLPTLPPWHPQVLFSVCESFSVLWIGSFVSYFRFHKDMISCGICLSLSDLLHLVWSSPVASILLQMVWFYFLWLNSINIKEWYFKSF